MPEGRIVLADSDELHWLGRLAGPGPLDILENRDLGIRIWVRPVQLPDTGVDAGARLCPMGHPLASNGDHLSPAAAAAHVFL